MNGDENKSTGASSSTTNAPENQESKHDTELMRLLKEDNKVKSKTSTDMETTNEDNSRISEQAIENNITETDKNKRTDNKNKEINDDENEKNKQITRTVRRGKRRARQMVLMGPKHKLTNKDIAKLLKKKRDMRKREASGNQEEEQSGLKKKRIPNRPGIVFEVGARLEAKDYLDKWYTSKIVAVDEEEAEILIHFERWSARFDEWMSMDSPRIRALTHPSTRNEQKEKVKISKSVLQHKVGEEVLARWTDCKMYPARILGLKEDGLYDVLFYDGFRRTVQPANIEKLSKEMIGKVDIPTVPKEEKVEKKSVSPKELVKSPPKRIGKCMKNSKHDEKDLKWILGKRKKLIVGGIFQAKRIKIEEEKHPVTPRKPRGRKRTTTTEEDTAKQNTVEVSDDDASVTLGYIDGRKIARKEFIIEEDHNHFKCKVPGCNKSFRKDKLLQSHMKHYHNNSDNKIKEKHHHNNNNSNNNNNNNNNNNSSLEETKEIPVKEAISISISEKSTDEEKDDKIQSPKKQETPKSCVKDIQTPNAKISKEEIKTNCDQESIKIKSPKVPKTEAASCKPSLNLEEKVSEEKPTNTESKPIKTENKNSKVDKNKPAKTDTKPINKTEKGKIKVENKPLKMEKPEKIQENLECLQEVKNSEEINVPKIEQEKKTENQTPIKVEEKPATLPVIEKPHPGRSKKRRTVSLPESNVTENLFSPDNNKDLKVINEVIDTPKLEEKINPEKPTELEIKVTPDSKHLIQDEEIEEGQSDEIVHCVCNCIEENGLMMQCEVCLTWQHGACFEIDDVKDVPDKYVCYACLKPKGLRESFRYKHDQDWFKKGELTTFSFLSNKLISNTDTQTSLVIHELVSSLHNILFVIHSLQCKLKIAQEENHPDLNLWRTPWDDSIHSLFSDDADLNQMQITRVADFDHSYSSLKQDLETANITNKSNDHWKSEERDWYIENKKKPDQTINTSNQIGETSQALEQQKSNEKSVVSDREKNNSKQGFKKEEKFNTVPDPVKCKKNLLDHVVYMQHNIEQQLNAIEDHLQMLETETGNSHVEIDKQMPKLLSSVRKLMKDLSLVQQLTQFQ